MTGDIAIEANGARSTIRFGPVASLELDAARTVAVADELTARHGREAQVRRAPASVTLSVRAGDVEEVTFRIMKHFVQNGILPRAEVRLNRGTRYVKYESMFKEDPQNYPISAVTKEEIIGCFIRYYRMVMSQGQAGQAD